MLYLSRRTTGILTTNPAPNSNTRWPVQVCVQVLALRNHNTDNVPTMALVKVLHHKPSHPTNGAKAWVPWDSIHEVA